MNSPVWQALYYRKMIKLCLKPLHAPRGQPFHRAYRSAKWILGGNPMSSVPKRPPVASDAWMLEQQVRAELEARAWQLMRQEAALLSAPARAEAAAEPKPAPLDPHRTGSAVLKGLVRFGLGAFASFLAVLAGADSGLGEIEVWLAAGAVFLITLALSLVNPLRRLVYALSEGMRWLALTIALVGLLWLWAAAFGSAPALPGS
jgi:hypothetical protein